MKEYQVYLGACDKYDEVRVKAIIQRALLLVRPVRPMKGKIVIKPNLVMAHPKVATEGFTRAEVIAGILDYLHENVPNIHKIDIVEKSGLGITTAAQFRHAGYRKLVKPYGVRLVAMEESRHRHIVLNKGRLHTFIRLAREMAERDLLIFAPKLKTNVLSHAFSGALKLNIGIVDSRLRLFHHNRDLPVKIVDLLEAANPDLIITDGIRMAYGGNQMTQDGTDVGVIIVANNAVAHDMVAASLLNLDPLKIEHIREAVDRGYGPSDLDEIEVLGDYAMDRAQNITKHLDFGFYPVHQFECNFDILSGEPYCVGGCHGIFLDLLHMIKDRKPRLLKKLPRLTAVIGRVDKTVEGKKVLLVGNCALATKDIHANSIRRIAGCPPSHKRMVWDMLVKYLILNPLVRPSLIFDAYISYPIKKLKGWLVNLNANFPAG